MSFGQFAVISANDVHWLAYRLLKMTNGTDTDEKMLTAVQHFREILLHKELICIDAITKEEDRPLGEFLLPFVCFEEWTKCSIKLFSCHYRFNHLLLSL